MAFLIHQNDLEVPVKDFKLVRTLKHNLEAVLLEPGIHWSGKDAEGVQLSKITQPQDVNFAHFSSFTTPSKDNVLMNLALENEMKFIGSTSSTTSTLAQIYKLVSNVKPISADALPPTFKNEVCLRIC